MFLTKDSKERTRNFVKNLILISKTISFKMDMSFSFIGCWYFIFYE